MLVLQRYRGAITSWIVGALAIAAIVSILITYHVEAGRTRDNFDDTLIQRAADVANVVVKTDGTIETNALDFAKDLNTAGIDVYIFAPDGMELAKKSPANGVEGLPAYLALPTAQGGGDDLRTLSLARGGTRVLTHPAFTSEDDSAHVAVIVQVGRPETELTATLNRLRLIMALIGLGVVTLAVGGGFLLARQAMIPVRQSLTQQQVFVANAAHELRTPLSVIQATAELALLRDRTSDEYRVALHEIGVAVEQTGALVDDLLTLARIDAGRQPLLRTPVDVGALAAHIAEETARTDNGQHPITVAADRDGATIAGDATLLQRLLVNLVENACRYTPVGTPVTIMLRPEREWLAVRVHDDGPGIPAQDVPHLFERFYRGSTGQESAHRGAGLGLSLVQQIADAHGGKVSIASGATIGTTATVLLPRTAGRTLPHLPALLESADRTGD